MIGLPASAVVGVAPLSPRLAALARLGVEAGRAILAMRPDPAGAGAKPDGSPVCAADRRAHDRLAEGLARLLPDVPVISEEDAGGTPPPPPGASFLLVDPLDGTREYLAGRRDYAVCIALLEAGRPRLGIIALPALGRLYAGELGAGAWRARIPADAAEPCSSWQPLPLRRPACHRTVVLSRSHADAASLEAAQDRPFPRLLRMGSALKFALVAEGRARLYPRHAPVMAWDVAAGEALVVASGGTVLSPDGMPLGYGDPARGHRLDGVVARCAPSHP